MQALSNPLYATPDLARFHLGRALAHKGDFQGSMEAFEDAMTVSPPSIPPALTNLELGRVYYQLGYKDLVVIAATSSFDVQAWRVYNSSAPPRGGGELCGGEPGPHKVEGIGVSFIPQTFDRSACDKIMMVSDEHAFGTVKSLAAQEGGRSEDLVLDADGLTPRAALDLLYELTRDAK